MGKQATAASRQPMTMPSDIEVAAELVQTRVDQEWSLKESLERRGQFLVGAGATASSLTVAAAALIIDRKDALEKLLESLFLAATSLHFAAGLFGALALLPLPLRVTKWKSLKNMVEAAESEPSSSGGKAATAAVAQAQLVLLKSLESQNRLKAAVLGIAAVAEVCGIALLAWAVVRAVDAF